MKLAVFDIDGTLTNTNSVDDDCFVQAIADAHSINDISTDWAEYPHTTDSGITLHIFQTRFGRAPETDETVKFQQAFFALLKESYRGSASLFAEIAGAADALEKLRRKTSWAVAIATGCWRESAEMKLKAAGIDASSIPSGFAEDGLSREEIIQAAITKSLAHYRQHEFEKIVSIGDGIWDVRAAARLNIPFLGVGSEESKDVLHRAGAKHVIVDFTDYKHFLECLDDAEVPDFKADAK
jgi:phosphoglycolate phosphatase-like HAD superfamily hydrolase